MTLGKSDYMDIKTDKYKCSTNDDFIKVLYIWDDFIKQVGKPFDEVTKWCEDNGIIYGGLLTVSDIRDELISTFIQNIGLDPYEFKYNRSIIRIKQCIYEGFRLNTATKTDKYRSDRTGVVLDVKSGFNKLIYRDIRLKEGLNKKHKWVMSCDRFCNLNDVLYDDTFSKS